MDLKILGSSSSGNCYILQNQKESLIIECGVNIKDIKIALGFDFTKVAGCLVTHNHGDHAKSITDVMKLGIDVYTSGGTIRALGLPVTHHRLKRIKAKEMVTIGNFKVIPFETVHDVPEPLGFIINHEETGSIAFITDTVHVKGIFFKNIHHFLIEANFSQKILDQRLADGVLPDFLMNRVFKSHMSLETCKQTLKANDLSKVQNIVLIHLSDGNSNASEFKREIEGATGKRTHIADAGMIIENFHRKPF